MYIVQFFSLLMMMHEENEISLMIGPLQMYSPTGHSDVQFSDVRQELTDTGCERSGNCGYVDELLMNRHSPNYQLISII